MNKKLTTTVTLALLVLGMTFSGAAQTLEGSNQISGADKDNSTSESSNIDVGISSTTAIDVKPESLTFSGLDVGTQTVEETTGSNTFGALELENIGSEYIDRVWASATEPSNGNPFGTGDPTNYNAGNFLQIKPNNATSKASIVGNTSTYHYVNRWEFSSSFNNEQGTIPSYIEADPENVGSSATDTLVGRFRAADEWYFYAIPVGSNSQCDGTSDAAENIIRIGSTPHSSSQFGTVDFTNNGPGDWTEYPIESTNGEYGVVSGGQESGETGVRLSFTDSQGDAFFREYSLLTVCDTSKTGIDDEHTIRTRYNVQAGGIEDLTVSGGTGDNATDRAQFLLNAGTANEMLYPGESMTVDTAIEVPQGVPEGDVTQGSITFYVTSDYDATVN